MRDKDQDPSEQAAKRGALLAYAAFALALGIALAIFIGLIG